MIKISEWCGGGGGGGGGRRNSLIVEPLFHKDWMEQFVARSDRYEFVVEALLIFYPTRGSIRRLYARRWTYRGSSAPLSLVHLRLN